MYCLCRLCCSVYCLCVDVYYTTATECQPISSKQIYRLHRHVISDLRMFGVLPPLASVARWVGTGEALPLRLLRDCFICRLTVWYP